MKTRTKNLTTSQQVDISYLYENGIKISEIAKYFEKNPATIYRLLFKMGKLRKKDKIKTAQKINEKIKREKNYVYYEINTLNLDTTNTLKCPCCDHQFELDIKWKN